MVAQMLLLLLLLLLLLVYDFFLLFSCVEKSHCFALLSKVWLAGCLWGNFCVQFQEFKIFTYGIQTRGGVAFRCCLVLLLPFFARALHLSLSLPLHSFCLPLDSFYCIVFACTKAKKNTSFPWTRRARERACFKPWLTAFTKYTFIIKFVVLWSFCCVFYHFFACFFFFLCFAWPIVDIDIRLY